MGNFSEGLLLASMVARAKRPKANSREQKAIDIARYEARVRRMLRGRSLFSPAMLP